MNQPLSGPQQVGADLLSFSVRFFSAAKAGCRSGKLRTHSLAFQAMAVLFELKDQDFTMSQLASFLDITKQQLTKLVNALEEKGLVERCHNSVNRRQVYIHLTSQGRGLFQAARDDMLKQLCLALEGCSQEELEELSRSIQCLSGFLDRLKDLECV